ERVLRRISREVVIPGFRPGKAPRNLVLAHYGEEAFRNEVREELIREWLNRALDREKLEPVWRTIGFGF
ncbi:trigger factor family protein, partial [Candidatus Bipolaricaulota bacterium]|nr:trigger factor family protein [Candidatus Bipolaricaulota bacterium]